MWRDGAVALSLANLCLLKVWGRVALYSGADAFHMKHFPGVAAILAASLNLALLTCLIWILVRLMRSARPVISITCRLLVAAVGLVALNSVRSVLFGRFPEMKGAIVTSLGGAAPTAGILGLLLAAAALGFVLRPGLRKAGAAALLVLAPLAPVNLAGAAGRALRHSRPAVEDPPLGTRIPRAGPGTRAVWVIFDEWGYRPAFEGRPAGLRTPRLERLRAESLFAVEAYPPAGDTIPSIPSLLDGVRYVSARNTGPDELMLRREAAGGEQPWTARDTVIGRMRERGVNTAVAGWHLPYCRILASALAACRWCEMARGDGGAELEGRGVLPSMAAQIRGLVQTTRFSLAGRPLGLDEHARSYLELMEAGMRFAADPELGFVFLHLPIPHAPLLRRMENGELGPGDEMASLELVDESVGRLIDAMLAGGVWRRTILLVSADHAVRGVRSADARVPFLFRLAGGGTGITVSTRLDTVGSADLLEAALQGRIADYAAAARCLGGVR